MALTLHSAVKMAGKQLKVDIHNHILPERWPDLKEVLVCRPMCYLECRIPGTKIPGAIRESISMVIKSVMRLTVSS